MTVRMMAGSEITMPALSSTMKEGKIVQWTVNVGDKVGSGDVLMVVESDKADMDVEAFEDGYIAKIIVPEGGTALVGSAVALVASTKEEIAAVAAAGEYSVEKGQIYVVGKWTLEVYRPLYAGR